MITLKSAGDFHVVVNTTFDIFSFDLKVSQKPPASHGFNMKTEGNGCGILLSLDDSRQSLRHSSFAFKT